TQTGSILDTIVADKAEPLQRRKAAEPESVLRERIAEFDAQWQLSSALASPRGAAPAAAAEPLIDEIKKASPSKGVLAADLDHLQVARDYTEGGAAGISVLTEENYFLGSLENLREVRRELQTRYPGSRPCLLRKDFVVEPYEVL